MRGGRLDKGSFAALLTTVPVTSRGELVPKLTFTAVSGQEAYPLSVLKDIKIQSGLPQITPCSAQHSSQKPTRLDDLACFVLPFHIVPLCSLGKCHSSCASLVSFLAQASVVIFKLDPVQPESPHKSPSWVPRIWT